MVLEPDQDTTAAVELHNVEPRSSSDSLLESSEHDLEVFSRNKPFWQDHQPRENHRTWIWRRATQWLLVILVGILAVFSFSLLNQRSALQSRIQLLEDSRQSVSLTLVDLLQAFYSPLIAVDAPSFTNAESKAFKITGEAVWKKPLGKDVLILDMDSRTFNASNQILHDGLVSWATFDGLSSGLLSHYAYALLHGYDYKFVQTPTFEDRGPSWAKPTVLASLLSTSQYRFVVFLDNDCIFHNPQIPLEWLLNHWNITSNTALSMPKDPYSFHNFDSRGKTILNTGFIIAQNLPRTLEMLRAWESCPQTDSAFPGCDKWKDKWTYEQTAFSEYIRYAFNKENDIKELACREANGYPEAMASCNGMLLRHYWIEKELLKGGVAETFMNTAMFGLRNAFMKDVDTLTLGWEDLENNGPHG